MSLRFCAAVVAAIICASVGQVHAQEDYPVHPDSVSRPDVPAGKVEGPFPWASKIFPGTQRNYWVYVPAKYDAQGTEPACLLVVQDGIGRANEWKLPTVMDNLIHKGEMPVTIGIFIEPGVVPAPRPDAQPRFNRSFEYDGLGDQYARFLIEEILPEVGKKYRLSANPNDRAIAGASSGGICAFTVAWERPDAFRRVLSTIGTFVGLRGGDIYPTLIRKVEPKPIRVFLQDGSSDLNIYGGDWWMANQTMLSALKHSGYEVKEAWGEGGHNGKHAAAIMPDALRWLWQGHPQPIPVPITPSRRVDLIIPNENWQLVSEGHKFTEGPTANDKGELFFTDIPNNKIHEVAVDGKVSVFVKESHGANGLMFGPDGMLYACQNGRKQIVRYGADASEEILLGDAPCNDLVVLPTGGYYTDPDNHRVWYVDAGGVRTMVDEGLGFPNGVITSPDQTILYVADTRSKFVYSYQIQSDGTLAHKQRFGHLHVPDDQPDSGADGMAIDTEGRLYVTTRMGVQVLDQLGRVNLILSKPDGGWLSNVTFGGEKRDTLYVTCGERVYRRKIKATGVDSWKAPMAPPKPSL